MSISDEMRTAFADYECDPSRMVEVDFGPDRLLVVPETLEAWSALERIFERFGYEIKAEETESYNCREVKSGGKKSLHSYGIALDVNWSTNPYLDHAGRRSARFSDKDTQVDRAEDVRLGKADTDMVEAMIDMVRGLKTKDGVTVFGWGGDWTTVKDAMHFQIQATPQQLEAGIDWTAITTPEPDEGDGDPGHADGAVPAAAATKTPAQPVLALKAEPEAFTPIDTDTTIQIGDDPMDLPAVFFSTIRKPLFFGSLSQTAVDNMTIIVNFWFENYPNNPLNQLAYILATVRAEVGKNMHPVREGFAKSDAAARRHVKHRKYGKPAGPFGHVYYGRGYVQLTWHSNYQSQSEKLGIDLEEFPDLALQPEHAIEILVNGMMDGDFNGHGHGLSFYVNESKQDFKGARRTVNIQDRADEIAGFAQHFLTALEKSNLSSSDFEGRVDLPSMVSAMSARAIHRPGSEPSTSVPVSRGGHATADSNSSDELDLQMLLAGLQSADAKALLTALGMDPASQAKFEKMLGLLASAGVIREGNGLTPVNRALGDTIGKLLDGRKTVLGVILFIVSIFMPQFGPIISLITQGADAVTTAAGTGAATGGGQGPITGILSSILMPVSGLLTGWGALGKIDKWLHKPKLNTLVGALSKLR